MLRSFEDVVTDFPVLNTSEPVVIVETSYAVQIEEFPVNSFTRQSLAVTYSSGKGKGLSSNFMLDGSSSVMTDSVAVINLPDSLFSSVNFNESMVRIVQGAFVSETLFLRRSQTLNAVPTLVVGSVVAFITVPGVILKDLEEPVLLTLWKNQVCILSKYLYVCSFLSSIYTCTFNF